MSTKKPAKLGNLPGANEPRGARGGPLPMTSLDTSDVAETLAGVRADQTLVGSPVSALPPRAAAVLFGRPANETIATRQSAPLSAEIASAPPEIELTQHQLPTDRTLDRCLGLVLDPDSERSAAFRVLRHHLLELGRPQCIVVSSARPGDGKTTVAVNLALALAECGRAKVLLVETHLRRPQLARVFELVPPWCFAEQIAAHRQQPLMPWSLVEIPQLWLHVGAVSPKIDKTQLLDGPAFAISLERLRLGGYDHIVVDAPPVLGSADVNLMADAADTVLLALRARTSTTRDLRTAIDQLGPGKVAGTVLVHG